MQNYEKILKLLPTYLYSLMIILLTLIIVKIFKKIFNKNIKLKSFDATQFAFIKHFISGIIYIFGIGFALSVIPKFKALSTSLFAGSGIIAVIIGFASQQAFSNIIGGIFIALFKPFRIGDRIKFKSVESSGLVEDINLRHTVIVTYENKRIIIPNALISSDVIENFNIIEDKICKFFEIGISYDSDVDLAIKIIKEEILKHKDYLDNRTEEEKKDGVEPVKVKIIGYGDFSVNLKAWIWAKNNSTVISFFWDLNYSVKKRFDEEGIEIPYPYRTIVIKKEK